MADSKLSRNTAGRVQIADAAGPSGQADIPISTPSRLCAQVVLPKVSPIWKLSFFSILACLLLLYWTGGWGTGANSDEMDMVAYGKANINWYTSGGTNTRFLKEPTHGVMSTLKYYGSGFEYLAQAVLAVAKPADGWEYDIRHMLNQALAIIGVLFAGLLARSFAGWRAAAITALVLGLTPAFWGHALFDTKDIPFAAGYVATVFFFVRLAENFPRFKSSHLIGFAVSMMFACSIRIGALVLLPAFAGIALLAFVQYRRAERGKVQMKWIFRWAFAVLIACVAALIGTVLLWPYAMLDPFPHIAESLGAATRFPQRIPFLFGGKDFHSLALPPYYLLRAIAVTLPVGVLTLFCAGIVGLLHFRWRTAVPLLVLVLASGLPLAFAVATDMPVYNGWRHVLFIYAPAVAALMFGVEILIRRLRGPALQSGACVAVFGCMIPSTVWSVRHQPYQYQYYNELVGGYRGAAYRYDTDYWQMSLREAFDWIATRGYVRQSKKPVTIATNGVLFGRMYMLQKYPELNVRVVRSGFKGRHANDWDYAAFSNLFLTSDVATHTWPPAHTSHTVEVDGVVLSVVLADTARYDFQGVTALLQGNPQKADSFFKKYLVEIGYRTDIPVYLGALDGYIGFTRLALCDTVAAAVFAERSLYTDPSDLVGNITGGLVLLGKGQWKDAYEFLSVARSVDSTLAIVNDALRKLEAAGVK